MDKKVIVFSSPTCSWCRKLKDYLRLHHVRFTDINIAADPKAANDMYRKSGQMGVPQLWINNYPLVGFDKEKIDKMLDLKNHRQEKENEL